LRQKSPKFLKTRLKAIRAFELKSGKPLAFAGP
jgi:hypothetical protein